MSRNLGIKPSCEGKYYFLSYNSEDEKRVAQYAKALHELGVNIWYDGGLKVGEEWEAEIAEKMEGCEAVIMFLSRNILEKENSYVHTEYKLATEFFNKKIYVVIIDEISKDKIPNRFKIWWIKILSLQCINAYEAASPWECMKKLSENLGDFSNENNKYGRIEFENGDVYEGEIINGVPHGAGKLVHADGSVYEGEFSEGKVSGKGKLVSAVGYVHEGEFINGVPHGKGKFVSADGCVYEGEFSDGEISGTGRFVSASGGVYEGEFSEGEMSGKGRYIFSNNEVYEGDFADGEFNGYGKYIFTDGIVYEGEFVNGNFHGKGKIALTCGRIIEGEFKNVSVTGECITKPSEKTEKIPELPAQDFDALENGNSKAYEGEIVNGEPNGCEETNCLRQELISDDYI